MNIQGWFPLGLTGMISLLYKGLSRAFSNTTIQKHQFFNVQSFFFLISAFNIFSTKNQAVKTGKYYWFCYEKTSENF